MESTGQRGTFGRAMFVLAAVVVVLAGMRLSAPVLNPILFALVFAALFGRVYSWLRRRLPTGLALLGMLVGLTSLFGGLFVLLSASITELTSRLGFYAQRLIGRVDDIQDLIDRLGLSDVDLSDAISGSALVGALGTVLSGLAGFLTAGCIDTDLPAVRRTLGRSDRFHIEFAHAHHAIRVMSTETRCSSLFLVLFIVLFLLSEGSAMMDRLRSGVDADNPQVGRLTFIGQSVVRQFGLRAIVNLVTGAGITVLLFVLGVDFPLLWGVLTFFVSYVPYVGLVLAAAPAVLLALAEFGPGRAILVIAGVVVINAVAENVLSPTLMGRGLSLSPTVVFLSFVFWAWLLGGPGAFLALPLTLFVAVMLETFPETRWLASLMGLPDTAVEAPAHDD